MAASRLLCGNILCSLGKGLASHVFVEQALLEQLWRSGQGAAVMPGLAVGKVGQKRSTWVFALSLNRAWLGQIQSSDLLGAPQQSLFLNQISGVVQFDSMLESQWLLVEELWVCACFPATERWPFSVLIAKNVCLVHNKQFY